MARKLAEKREPKRVKVEDTDWYQNSPALFMKDTLLKTIKLSLKCKSENQKKFVNMIREKEITICAGAPGTGKTFLACHLAIELLKQNSTYEKIVLVKSVTPLKSEEIGFLKGTLEEKMEPFVFSFMHNFQKIIGKPNVDKLKQEKIIDVIPIAYMRGINIDNAIIIIDEVQNITIDNMHTILTRLGSNSKMIFLGDLNQIDMKNKKETSLKFLLEKFGDVSEIGVVELSSDDIVRNVLIKKIEKIFSEHEKSNK